MVSKIAIIGNVNTEEVFAKLLKEQGGVEVHAYTVFPNDAFTNVCDRAVHIGANGYDLDAQLIPELKSIGFDVIHLGPIFVPFILSQKLMDAGIAHLGATPSQLSFEADKTLLSKVFSDSSGVIPRRVIVRDFDKNKIRDTLKRFSEGFVLKFVGAYNKAFPNESEVGRVRISDQNLSSDEEAYFFIEKSIEIGGAVVIEEQLHGREFSSNFVVDGKGAVCRLGENLCYKRRGNGNTGPMCDGAGSVMINQSLPFLTSQDIQFVEEQIVVPFHKYVSEHTRHPLRAIFNVDLMKTDDGRVVLFEVNCRQAGGHSMSTILSGLETSLFDILEASQNDQLGEIEPQFKSGVSVAVSAWPSYFPLGTSEDSLKEIKVTKDIPVDVKLYTGWVDVLEDAPEFRRFRMRNSPTLLFENHAESIRSARSRVYETIEIVVGNRLGYRTDIAQEFLEQ